MTIDLVVGCPVRQRQWIIQDWFDHVELTSVELGWAPTYAFVGDRRDPTMGLIEQRCADQDRRLLFVHVDDDDVDRPDERVWNQRRFQHMVDLRNTLLGVVRAYQPRYFLSIDSDILIGHHTLGALVESTARFAAVGGATWMTPTTEMVPSCGWLRGSAGLIRQRIEHTGVIPVGVIMAIKLMTPPAYAVDYQLHAQGEDVGWSAACAKAGVKLGWDNRYPSKHVMSPDTLDKVDVRCGW